MICDHVLEKCCSARLRRRLHLEETLTLDAVFNTLLVQSKPLIAKHKKIKGAKNSECEAEKSFAHAIQPRPDTSQEFRPDPPANQITTPN